VAKLKAKIQNYLWVGEDRPYRSRVAWDTCYLPKREGGLRLVDLANAMVALMSKWILTAMEPGDSNLKSLLRHRLAQYQLYSGGNWALNLQWFILKNHASKAGSKVWVQTARSWKQLVGGIWSVLIASFEEWLSASIWWDEGFSNISPLFSRLRAAPLSRQGLIHVRDAWLPENNSFVSSGVAAARFGLQPQEFATWETLCQRLLMHGQHFLIQRSVHPEKEEWLRFYASPLDSILQWVP
jgi:hypothetical protein